MTRSISFSHSIERTIGHHLVGRWSFDEGVGTMVRDRSPYGNHGTIHGASFSEDTPHDLIDAGAGRYSLSFDGDGDYVSISNHPSLHIGEGFTLELWVKPPDRPPTHSGYAGKRGSNDFFCVAIEEYQ